MEKNLRTNRIFRILAGIYLLYLSTSIWRELDTSGNKIIGIAFIILFVAIGIVFILLSARDLMNMKKEGTQDTEEMMEEKTDASIDEIMEKLDDTEETDETGDFVSDVTNLDDDAKGEPDMDSDQKNLNTDDGVEDSSDSNVIDNIKDHTQN